MFCVNVHAVCGSYPLQASAHVSVGCILAGLPRSGCQTESSGEPTYGKGRPDLQAKEHMPSPTPTNRAHKTRILRHKFCQAGGIHASE